MTNDPHNGQPVLTLGSSLDKAKGAVILLHGRGASASDILGLASEFYHPDLAYLAPEAAGHAWYPFSFMAPLEQNEPWLSSALSTVKRVLQQITSAGIPPEKTVVAGFSQGACLASEFVARNAIRYGGLVAFTGGLIGPPDIEFNYAGNLGGTPAFFGAGDHDPHVPWERVQESADTLSKLGAKVTVKQYPGMPHIINREEIVEARRIVLGVAAQEVV